MSLGMESGSRSEGNTPGSRGARSRHRTPQREGGCEVAWPRERVEGNSPVEVMR
jgi:hypothetical protein